MLKRKYVQADSVVYIGKEANKVGMQELESNHIATYPDIEKLREFVLNLTPDKARDIGIKHRSTLKKIKDRVKEGEFNLNTKEMRKVMKHSA